MNAALSPPNAADQVYPELLSIENPTLFVVRLDELLAQFSEGYLDYSILDTAIAYMAVLVCWQQLQQKYSTQADLLLAVEAYEAALKRYPGIWDSALFKQLIGHGHNKAFKISEPMIKISNAARA